MVKVIIITNAKEKAMFQKLKFRLISRMVMDLFSNKNSPTQYKDISKKIVVLLKSFDDNYPTNIYSEASQESFKGYGFNFQETLSKEIEVN